MPHACVKARITVQKSEGNLSGEIDMHGVANGLKRGVPPFGESMVSWKTLEQQGLSARDEPKLAIRICNDGNLSRSHGY